MTAQVIARAPGKLFLLGEYAVLDGCPAVVIAIDRHVEATVHLGAGEPAVVIEGMATAVTFGPQNPPPPEGPLRFAVAAYRSAVCRLAEIARGRMRIRVVSRLTAPDGAKGGLGSSAAVSVAVVAALFASADRDLNEAKERNELFATALAAHRAAQGNTGSGADVAASTYGGLVFFQTQNGNVPSIRPLAFPGDASLLAGWTGASASTPALVSRYRAAAQTAAAQHCAFLQASRTCVQQFVKELQHGRVCCDALNENGRVLEKFDDELRLGIMTPRFRDLVRIARTAGAGAKPSGAGGGDCGIALTQDREIANRVRAGWRQAGIVPLDLQIDHGGVTIEHR